MFLLSISSKILGFVSKVFSRGPKIVIMPMTRSAMDELKAEMDEAVQRSWQDRNTQFSMIEKIGGDHHSVLQKKMDSLPPEYRTLAIAIAEFFCKRDCTPAEAVAASQAAWLAASALDSYRSLKKDVKQLEALNAD